MKRFISIFAIFATSLPVLSYSATQSSYPTKGIPVAGDKALITDSADGNKTKQATVGSFPISTATQTALDGKETKAVVQASAPADTTVDWYDTDQESGVLILKRHNGTTWVRASSHGVQYASNCAGITAGMCVDTDDGKLYYHNNTSVVEVGVNIDLSNYLSKTNTTAFSPTGDYHPATKKYVDDAVTAGGGYTDEQAQDAVGGMFSGNAETGITVTYDDSTGKVNFAVATQSDVNFTSALNTKLAGIATGAEVNVNADWNSSSGDSQILNKPTIPVIPTGAEGDFYRVGASGMETTAPLTPVDTSSIDVATSGDNVTFSVIPTYIQRRVSGTCTAGSSIRAIAEDGTVTCETDDNSGGSGGGVFEELSVAPYSDVACTSNGLYSHTAYFCVDGYYTEQATTTAYSNPSPVTYSLTVDGTGWNGSTDTVAAGGTTLTADGTITGLSGSTVPITATAGSGRSVSCSGTGITGTAPNYIGDMTSNRSMSCTFASDQSPLLDTFTVASDTILTDHSPDLGGAWYSTGGNNVYIEAASDTLKSTASTENFAIINTPNISEIYADIKPASIGYALNGVCLSESYNMNGDAYCAFIKPGTDEFMLVKWVDRSWVSTSATNTGVVYANKYTDVYTVSLETTGSHILASVKNGSTVLSSIDFTVNFSGGYGGVIISGTSVSIDNVTGN